jgi:hypothetical protein
VASGTGDDAVARAAGWSRLMIWLAIIAILALIPLIWCAVGTFWGPGIFGLVFLLPALVLLLGHSTQGVALGLVCLVASIVELSAAHEYWTLRNSVAGPSRGWRALATLVGLAGSVFLLLMAYALFVFLAWLRSIS